MDPRPNYDECVQIEEARCEVRKDCMKDDDVAEAYSDFDFDTCIAYSKEHCRTREIQGEKWDQKNITACVEAIRSLKYDCKRLLPKGEDETEAIGQCNFIENGDAGPIDLAPKSHDTDTLDSGAASTDDTSTSPVDAGA
jgi:hypothetical protein